MQTPQEEKPKLDWRLAIILLGIWFLGLVVFNVLTPGASIFIQLVVSVFFIILLPAMQELILSIEKLQSRSREQQTDSDLKS